VQDSIAPFTRATTQNLKFYQVQRRLQMRRKPLKGSPHADFKSAKKYCEQREICRLKHQQAKQSLDEKIRATGAFFV
jgi:hypothetical protein